MGAHYRAFCEGISRAESRLGARSLLRRQWWRANAPRSPVRYDPLTQVMIRKLVVMGVLTKLQLCRVIMYEKPLGDFRFYEH